MEKEKERGGKEEKERREEGGRNEALKEGRRGKEKSWGLSPISEPCRKIVYTVKAVQMSTKNMATAAERSGVRCSDKKRPVKAC